MLRSNGLLPDTIDEIDDDETAYLCLDLAEDVSIECVFDMFVDLDFNTKKQYAPSLSI